MQLIWKASTTYSLTHFETRIDFMFKLFFREYGTVGYKSHDGLYYYATTFESKLTWLSVY